MSIHPLFSMFSGPEIIIAVGAAVLLFGGNKIRDVARSLGAAQREFKAGQTEADAARAAADAQAAAEAPPAAAQPAAAAQTASAEKS